MKKLIAVCIFALMAVSLFAFSGHTGASAFYFATSAKGNIVYTNTEDTFNSNGEGIMFSGVEYFGRNENFGVGFNFGLAYDNRTDFSGSNIYKRLGSSEKGTSIEVVGSVLFMYRQEINEDLALEFGTGMVFSGFDDQYNSNEALFTYGGFCGQIDVDYELTNDLDFIGGIQGSAILATVLKRTISGVNQEISASVTGHFFSFHVGLAHTF